MESDGDQQGMRVAVELFEIGVEIQRRNLRREMPHASDARIEELLAAWLLDRPGAPLGDAEGRVCHRDFRPR